MELIENLSEQLSIINTLTETTRREREALISRDIELLQNCRQEKDKLQENLLLLEQKRSALCHEQTLQEIAAAPEAPSDKLLDLRRQLKTALRLFKSEHDTNIIIYKHEMAYFNTMREAISTKMNAQHYTNKGAIAKHHEAISLSKRA
ncbi:flagellar protein FlgN [Dethiobacter alkaliphilus]|uniref:flagellar protein FlgN n=1 Tax=Dethiobacter alkaliphilus TaxID=427926 RepID=UPI002226E95D|nr:flagellar protein FlgN [Dethiobacter alkaliphilus]MCW3488756.1 flagellar protein FlgN [Dethiobacter alkaliphilus]